MRVHLVTYATPRFRHRQLLLGQSAKWNRVCDRVTHWTPNSLQAAGFHSKVPNVSLQERGSGFWSWKPFVIQETLQMVPAGDWVFYCDVGRRFPYKMLNRSLHPFVKWVENHDQDFLPGLSISWRGNMSVWTKRDAFVLTDMDDSTCHQLAPIQASFSLWKAGRRSLDFLNEWQTLCARRELISDDPSTCGLPELPDFLEHRHDQALLTLCCHRSSCHGLNMGPQSVPFDTRNPTEVLAHVFSQPAEPITIRIHLLNAIAGILQKSEAAIRSAVKFGRPAKSHPYDD